MSVYFLFFVALIFKFVFTCYNLMAERLKKIASLCEDAVEATNLATRVKITWSVLL
jgi:hypothetical protein